MENKKDIGKAISDKLNSLDKSPGEQVWSGISYELEKKKKRRTAFFFFWGKVIGLVLMGSIAALYFYHQDGGFNLISPNDSKDTITVSETNGKKAGENISGENLNDGNSSSDNSINNDSKIKNNETKTNNSIATDGENAIESNNGINSKNNIDKKRVNSKGKFVSSKKGKTSTSTRKSNPNGVSLKSGKNKSSVFSKKKSKKSDRKSAKKSKLKSKKEKEALLLSETKTNKNDEAVVDLSSLQDKNSSDLTSELKKKKTDSIAKKEKEKTITIDMFPKDSTKKDSAKIYRKFYVDAFMSPTLYGYFSEQSTLDRDLDSLPKKSEIKFSYGFGLTYDLTERVSVRIGYRKVNISYLTKNAPIGVNMPDTNNFTGISYNPEISNTSIYIASDGSETMDITQKISYTEIPLEVKYNFLTKKLGLKSSFGFSYLMLNENKVSIKTPNGFSQDIGKTKNLSGTSVSVNLGLEMDYPLFKNTKIFVEPMFNYQIKAFSDGNFKPYVFGIHTGIRYSFNN